MEEDIDEENQVDGKLPLVADPLLENLKNVLFGSYLPVYEFGPGVVFMSTREIWSMLQRLYPNELLYGPADVARWMFEKGFKYKDQGLLNFEWMMKHEPDWSL